MERRPSTQIEFVKIPAGEFMMGCVKGDTDCIEDEVPTHKVRLTKGFELGQVRSHPGPMGSGDGPGSNPSDNKGPRNPVDNVSKDDIHAFLDKLNARNDGYKYRLPTEAEWEYAARAGAPDPPRASLGDYAWFADNSDDESHPVGLKKPNAWGLYDMLGNVREWVDDRAAYYDYISAARGRPWTPRGRGPAAAVVALVLAEEASVEPVAVARMAAHPRGSTRRGGSLINGGGADGLPVFRGGGWDNFAPYLRLSSRYYYYDTDLKVGDIGFRVAREAQ